MIGRHRAVSALFFRSMPRLSVFAARHLGSWLAAFFRSAFASLIDIAPTRHFHGRFTRGEKLRASWVNESDFEPAVP
jgi:hypothetical protein